MATKLRSRIAHAQPSSNGVTHSDPPPKTISIAQTERRSRPAGLPCRCCGRHDNGRGSAGKRRHKRRPLWASNLGCAAPQQVQISVNAWTSYLPMRMAHASMYVWHPYLPISKTPTQQAGRCPQVNVNLDGLRGNAMQPGMSRPPPRIYPGPSGFQKPK